MALPASETYDYEGVRARLADPDLADAGVVVALLGVPLLAVPVGGVRRGGYASFGGTWWTSCSSTTPARSGLT